MFSDIDRTTLRSLAEGKLRFEFCGNEILIETSKWNPEVHRQQIHLHLKDGKA